MNNLLSIDADGKRLNEIGFSRRRPRRNRRFKASSNLPNVLRSRRPVSLSWTYVSCPSTPNLYAPTGEKNHGKHVPLSTRHPALPRLAVAADRRGLGVACSRECLTPGEV